MKKTAKKRVRKAKPKVRQGDIFTSEFDVFGHRCAVVKVIPAGYGKNRVELSCIPDCCTSPYGLKLECTEADLAELKRWYGRKGKR